MNKLLLLPVMALLVFAGFALLPLSDWLLTLLDWCREHAAWGPVVLAGLYVLANLILFPGWILSVAAGFLFGLGTGVASVVAGGLLGACLTFFLGRSLARAWVLRQKNRYPMLAGLDADIGRHGFKLVLLLRLSPVTPYNILNYALGLSGVPFWKYVWATFLGMLPQTVVLVYSGRAMRSLAEAASGFWPEDNPLVQVFFWLGLAATVGAAVLITQIAHRHLHRLSPRKEEPRP